MSHTKNEPNLLAASMALARARIVEAVVGF